MRGPDNRPAGSVCAAGAQESGRERAPAFPASPVPCRARSRQPYSVLNRPGPARCSGVRSRVRDAAGSRSRRTACGGIADAGKKHSAAFEQAAFFTESRRASKPASLATSPGAACAPLRRHGGGASGRLPAALLDLQGIVARLVGQCVACRRRRRAAPRCRRSRKSAAVACWGADVSSAGQEL